MTPSPLTWSSMIANPSSFPPPSPLEVRVKFLEELAAKQYELIMSITREMALHSQALQHMAPIVSNIVEMMRIGIQEAQNQKLTGQIDARKEREAEGSGGTYPPGNGAYL